MGRTAIAAMLLGSLVCWGASAGLAASSPAAAEVVWHPSEAAQGGSQYDARLDQPVRLWGAGIALRDVFGELTRQTGVAFDFAAPEGDEPRLCVTLYLNPERPPELRGVMAQLMWVTGCSFTYTEEPAGRAYHLIWSSVGQGAAEQLAGEAAARREQFEAEREARQREERRRTSDLLQEARDALALSQSDAIARYRGSNDALLLNLLDPARRAGLSFLAGLPEEDVNSLFTGRGPMVTRGWSECSPEQQAELKQALGLGELPKGPQVQVLVGAGRGGMLAAVVPSDGRPQFLGRVGGLLASGDLRPRQQAQLRALLGEPEPAQGEGGGGQAAAQQGRGDRQQQRAQQRQQWQEQREQAQAEARSLSSQAEGLLASATIPAEDARGSLWQVQEAVAKATGMSVVSDCFSTPRFRFGPPGQAPAGTDTMDALEALSEASAAFGPGFGGGPPGLGGGAGGDDLGHQWGDAGAFLRFRAQRPDLWRGAMLPAEVQTRLDEWLKPFVSTPTATETRGPGNSPLASDLEKTSWLASHLNDLQIQLGGAIPYEDPTDETGARLQALRRQTLQQLGFVAPALRMLGSLDGKQWARLKGEGLRWGYDLMPEQQSAEVVGMLRPGAPQDRAADMVMKLGMTEERTVRGRGGERTIPSAPALEFALDGESVGEIALSGGWGFGPGGGGFRGGRGGGGG
jgi:hypothetical protein